MSKNPALMMVISYNTFNKKNCGKFHKKQKKATKTKTKTKTKKTVAMS